MVFITKALSTNLVSFVLTTLKSKTDESLHPLSFYNANLFELKFESSLVMC